MQPHRTKIESNLSDRTYFRPKQISYANIVGKSPSCHHEVPSADERIASLERQVAKLSSRVVSLTSILMKHSEDHSLMSRVDDETDMKTDETSPTSLPNEPQLSFLTTLLR